MAGFIGDPDKGDPANTETESSFEWTDSLVESKETNNNYKKLEKLALKDREREKE